MNLRKSPTAIVSDHEGVADAVYESMSDPILSITQICRLPPGH